ncbi:TIGR02281 family clan AA aspartic protease [Erythrobacter sp. 3-20A1M]|uniref:retropepsin-like aspartic protease family protein n=1 Tax=Erythrobacter sp. 3-20A1M TaxID=2653850 RepID=UPI001BFC90A1|nr:TIGR02281 family clan AA aspartic protease [Erythrobacter sp. 3-20A1M]QWC55983.1 TIGR02281 family clan AA aspartic protease [Erythrobacter sp. 3-20A1M]
MELLADSAYIERVDPKTLFDALLSYVADIPQSELLMAALAAMVLGWVGAMMARRRIPLGRLVGTASTVVLVGVLALVVVQVARMDPRFDVAMSDLGLPEQRVEGKETRVPLAPDGHYWLKARVNGEQANFLVDTGATLTAISARTAERAGIEPRRDRMPVMMTTANGTVRVGTTTIDELRFGNVAARGLDAVIAPNLGNTNVIGMNLLSRLAGWRVENGELILVPNHPQPEADTTE